MTTPSLHVGFKASQTHYYAEGQARRLGTPLTHYIVINFASTGVDPRQAVPAFSRLRRHDFNKWARRPTRRGGPAFVPTYAYTFENERDGVPFLTMEPGDPHNVHVNWSVHLPPERVHDFEHQIWEWVDARADGIAGGAETIHIQPITTTLGGYLIKGAQPKALALYGRGQEPMPQGLIIGRRSSTSQNLGPAARRAVDRKLGIKRRLPTAPRQPSWWQERPPPA